MTAARSAALSGRTRLALACGALENPTSVGCSLSPSLPLFALRAAGRPLASFECGTVRQHRTPPRTHIPYKGVGCRTCTHGHVRPVPAVSGRRWELTAQTKRGRGAKSTVASPARAMPASVRCDVRAHTVSRAAAYMYVVQLSRSHGHYPLIIKKPPTHF